MIVLKIVFSVIVYFLVNIVSSSRIIITALKPQLHIMSFYCKYSHVMFWKTKYYELRHFCVNKSSSKMNFDSLFFLYSYCSQYICILLSYYSYYYYVTVSIFKLLFCVVNTFIYIVEFVFVINLF